METITFPQQERTKMTDTKKTSRPRLNKDAKITVLTKSKFRGKRGQNFSILKNKLSVASARKAGVPTSYLNWYADQKHIAIAS